MIYTFKKVKIFPFLLLLLFIGTAAIYSGCKKEKPEDNNPGTTNNNGITAEKTNVKTFEIINLKVNQTLSDKYNATFGSTAIELLKTSDSTLTFYVPDVTEGAYALKFELADINFNVTKTPEVNADQLVSVLFQNFDTKVSELNPVTNEEKSEVDSMNIFKQEILKVFNSLTEEQKRQTALFYEANKEVFKSFSDNVQNNFDAPTSLGKQSDCPRTDYKTFYDCTSANLANSYSNFKSSSREFVRMIAMAGAMGGVALKMSALGPVALGITAVGMSLPLSMAIYLGAVEVWPAWVKLRNDTYEYLKAPWIFREELFNSIQTEYGNDSYTDLNLDAGFRTLKSGDGDVTQNTGTFISALSSLNTYWEKLSSLFGKLPSFQSNQKNVTLTANEIKITNISNPYVKLFEQDGEKVKFKSTTGNEETFTYNIKVNKEGFVEEKTVDAKVLAGDPCTNGSMSAPVINNVQLECNSNNQIAMLISFTANGTGALISSGSGWCDPENTCYPVRLYFLNPGAPEYSIAYNGYNVRLKSGNSNNGVIEITIKNCISGKSAIESLESYYPGYKWKIELMNQCNQRSNQISL